MLAEALLHLDPAGRPTAEEALLMPYFTTEEPAMEQPYMFVLARLLLMLILLWLHLGRLASVEGDWHELEAKALTSSQSLEAIATYLGTDVLV